MIKFIDLFDRINGFKIAFESLLEKDLIKHIS